MVVRALQLHEIKRPQRLRAVLGRQAGMRVREVQQAELSCAQRATLAGVEAPLDEEVEAVLHAKVAGLGV